MNPADQRYGADSDDSPLRDLDNYRPAEVEPKSPHEIQHDAIDYVKQWRDEERARYANAERTTVIWPNGPYDFVMVQIHEVSGEFWPTPAKGWTFIAGRVVEPEDPPHGWLTLYCRPVNGGYEMIPKRPQ